MNNLNDFYLAKSQSYKDYYEMVEMLVKNNQTSGPNQTPELAAYTKLNFQRMKRLTKTAKPGEGIISALKNIKTPMTWIVISEAWCGDAAQSTPYIANLANTSEQVDLKFILRDENHDIMNKYLTNGGMSIPKLIIFNSKTGVELAHWGPRPRELQELMTKFKEEKGNQFAYEELSEMIHQWYARNKNQTIQEELLSLITSIN
jgi:hypothetical protein